MLKTSVYSEFPYHLKEAHIFLYKKNSHLEAGNYRPVILLAENRIF